MLNWQLKTPVVFIIFKRPDTTEKVLEVIRQVKPSKLFVIADGSRNDHPGEIEKCEASRKIIDKVDWECEVIKNYSDTNLGCKLRVSSGLDWVFQNVDEAIILEDDCVPDITFFHFCESLLEKYRYNQKIMSIAGLSIPVSKYKTDYSYSFSIYNRIWGWATWKRAWKYYDVEMQLWPHIRESNFLRKLLENKNAVKYWTKIFQDTYKGKIDTWDYQWTFASWIHNGLNIIPNMNLVTNIGFGKDATHTFSDNPKGNRSQLSLEKINFPLLHPPIIVRDLQAEEWLEENVHNIPNNNILKQIKNRLNKIIYA